MDYDILCEEEGTTGVILIQRILRRERLIKTILESRGEGKPQESSITSYNYEEVLSSNQTYVQIECCFKQINCTEIIIAEIFHKKIKKKIGKQWYSTPSNRSQ